MNNSIVILDGYTVNPGDLSWQELDKLGDVTIYERTTPEDVISRSLNADIILTNKVLITKEIIAQLPKLKYIGVLATGYNVVDLEAATQCGITVTNIPAYSTKAVAQLVFSFILQLCQNVSKHDEAVKNGDWVNCIDFSFTKSPLIELDGQTMGLVGYGAIGKAVAKLALAFDMKVLVHTRTIPKTAPKGLEFTDLDRVLSQSDIISLHCPLNEKTQSLINAQTLGKMKKSAFLINTGRGPLIDEQAVADALNSGDIAGGAVDVLSTEPPKADNPMLTATNCIITPHIAWAAGAARKRLIETACKNVEAFISGTAQNVVN